MKKILKKLFIYSCGLTIATIFVESRRFGITGNILGLLVICAILFDIGRIIKNKTVQRKYFIYLSIIVCQILLLQLISVVLDVGTVNTWLGLVGANVILGTMFTMFFDIARILKNNKKFLGGLLLVIALLGTAIMILLTVGIIVVEFL